MSTLSSSLVISHSVALTGLSASTTYHFQVLSRDSQGNLATSSDFTFTTATQTGPTPLLQIQGNASEVSGLINRSTVTPSIGPAGFTGSTIVQPTGSINFAPTQSGTGVYFLNCCTNTGTAYYKFVGTAIGNVFNASQGQVSFSLQSRYTFAQRQTSAAAPRYTFDVRDGSGNHLFYFQTQVTAGRLVFTYRAGSATTSGFYYVPLGTEDALYGNGVNLNVSMSWNGSSVSLYLNNNLVQTTAYTATTPNWSSSTIFDLGAFEYLTYGGYNVSDDIIDQFTVN
jgi:hypothetical protein